MSRTIKPKAAQDTISVQDAIAQLATNEQVFRLALLEVRPDDFDTIKTLPVADFEAVAKKLNQPQLPAQPKNSEIPKPQDLQPATDEPQNAPIVPQSPRQQLTNPTQAPTADTGLTLVDQFTKQVSEEIQLVDAIAQVRNTLILNNLAVRDAELTEGMNQRWQAQKNHYIGTIRGLTDLAQTKPEISQDTTDVQKEIDTIISDLGKRINA